MPNITPFNEETSWPADEGVLGVIGVAPWSTLAFLKILYEQVPAQKDWHFPRVLIDINTKLPSRGRFYDLGERDFAPYIKETIKELAEQGATAVAVTCNTAHIRYAMWAENAPVPIINIIDAVTNYFTSLTHGSQIAIFASKSTCSHQLFDKSLNIIGLEVFKHTEQTQNIISAAIEEVKQFAHISPRTKESVQQIVENYKLLGVQGIIIGCTELASLQPICEKHIPIVIESNYALAHASLKEISAKISQV
ncbi:aspartate/glutamate racemase family protein [Pectobacterium versatile]|uniref:aspartate/glutamate racemase family protein n=1 Tax=Pectobacterium versatile TaxID=2488639 RepID=UPI000D1A64BB|nr:MULTISPECIES: aspartate/glutamate racemase family protein [Pectobacterium]AVT58267.1 aspartate racemase [Pectobacterium versatile]MCL6340457.1 aspartate/glutamate racemase family protein [Pectobacterium carotovorum subsp. carotovorum]MCL6344757.1 aspartate/glutamate racemase family protein [Pectobacterium carotovorum subsp. carotovorum]